MMTTLSTLRQFRFNMGFLVRSFVIFICCIVLSPVGRAQGDSFLEDFQVSRFNTHVFLNWQLRHGNTCNGISIYRSTDSIQFTRIGLIPGICGSPTEAARYHFIDSDPELNRRNYYQLEFGGVGVSSIIGIDFLDFSLQGYQIWPNPSDTDTRIFIQNEEGQAYSLHVYIGTGVPFRIYNTSSDQFYLDTSAWPSGIFPFTIQNANGHVVSSGSLLVQH